MTEKRYVLFNHKDTDYILDTPNTDLDFIEMLGDALTSEEIVDLLNEQDEEIKRLKYLLIETDKELKNMTQRYEYELKMKLKYHSELIDCKNGDIE